MKQKLKNWLLPLSFTLGGAVLGYLYYRFFGCQGSCPITSSPVLTMLYMGFIGLLVSGIVKKDKKEEETG